MANDDSDANLDDLTRNQDNDSGLEDREDRDMLDGDMGED